MDWAKGYLAVRELEGGLYLAVMPMLFTYRLGVCDEHSVMEFWCYETLDNAMVGYAFYPEVPEGWSRHFVPGVGSVYPEPVSN